MSPQIKPMPWAIFLFVMTCVFTAAPCLDAADAPFRRGDINDDSTVDISDPIVLLAYLFNSGETPGCMDSADTNDDGLVNVGDAISVLGYIFGDGSAPPAPGPLLCGLDLTDDTLGCFASSCDEGGDPQRLAAGHLLNRIAYGPLPGQIDEVLANGLDATILSQLNPAPGTDPNPVMDPLEQSFTVPVPLANERFLLRPNGRYRYFLGTEEPPADWAQPTFDDSGWLLGTAGFGRGDRDDVTEIVEINNGLPSVYARTQFIRPITAVTGLPYLKMLFDDGFVAYLNGVEFARSLRTNGVPHLEGTPPTFDQYATQNHEATFAEYYPIPAGLLQPGLNTLAIQCHNAVNSGDFTLRPQIVTMALTGGARNYFPGSSELQRSPFIRGIYSENQLQKVLGEFWENHFLTDEDKLQEFFGQIRNRYNHRVYGNNSGASKLSNTLEFEEYDFFCDNALGQFGDLLLYSASSVPMLVYLDSILNNAAQPNENYAREILELHTLGVDNGYTQADIEEVARIFTGWSVTRVPNTMVQGFPGVVNNPVTTDFHSLTETALIELGDEWNYFKGFGEPSPDVTGAATTEWTQLGFDDSTWLVGPTGIGMGDGDDATVLDDMDNNYTCFYARKVFNIADPAMPEYLELAVDFDDGFICYLNGVEIQRSSNMNQAGSPAPFTAIANGGHEAGGRPDLIDLNHLRPLLVAGENILAFQICNLSITNNDASFLPRLTAGVPTARHADLNDRQGKWVFRFNPGNHDFGAKVIFPGTPYELNIPEGRIGVEGVQDAFDLVASLEAHPGTAQFICMKLIQKFVSDDISLASLADGSAPLELQGLLASMIGAWYSTPRPGNIGVVMETLLDPIDQGNAFWNPLFRRNKVKTPVEFVISTLRALGSPANSDNLVGWASDMGMEMFERDDPDGFPEVGNDWIGTTTLLQRINFARRFAANADNDFPWNLADIIGDTPLGAQEVIDIFDEVLFQSSLTEAERCLAMDYLESGLDGSFLPLDPAAADYSDRVRDMVGYLFSLPRFQFQ